MTFLLGVGEPLGEELIGVGSPFHLAGRGMELSGLWGWYQVPLRTNPPPFLFCLLSVFVFVFFFFFFNINFIKKKFFYYISILYLSPKSWV